MVCIVDYISCDYGMVYETTYVPAAHIERGVYAATPVHELHSFSDNFLFMHLLMITKV